LHFVFNSNIICVLITYEYTNGEFVLQIPCYTKPNNEDWKDKDYTNTIQCIVSDTVRLNDLEIVEVKHWHMKNIVTSKWYQDNVFIIGDAAHQFPPSGGYGLNTGIVDCFSLAWRLYYLTNNPKERTIHYLKDTFEKERIIHTKVFNLKLVYSKVCKIKL
jgi:2-polyprenyl-6-methoxyphenol hydroxylase-like FAD-dependent oxidoreductase